MKILIEESVLRNAIATLEFQKTCFSTCADCNRKGEKAIIALRSALDTAEKIKPVAWMQYVDKYGDNEFYERREYCRKHREAIPLYDLRGIGADTEKAAPVAWTTMPEASEWDFVSGSQDPNGKLEGTWYPLYAAPVGITDELGRPMTYWGGAK